MLPDYTTVVSYDLGGLLEAMKQHSLSFKLSKKAEFSRHENEIWRQLSELVRGGRYSDLARQVKDAVEFFPRFEDILQDIPHLGRAHLNPAAKSAAGISSIRQLVERLSENYGNRDSEEGPIKGPMQDALEMIFEPPGPELFVKCMKEARDPGSSSSWHRKAVSEGLKNRFIMVW